MTGTKLPALFSSAKKSRPFLAASLARRAAGGEAGGIDAEDRLVRGARIARQRHRVGVLGLEQVGPVGRRLVSIRSLFTAKESTP